MAEGYIYCISNECMPGILKVGMTERTPEERLTEANSSDTWRPPTPYKIEFAKRVLLPKQKEKALHTLLGKYTERVNPRREFFRASLEEVRSFFDLLDGEEWASREERFEAARTALAAALTPSSTEASDEETPAARQPGCRDMAKCFTDGQRIRYKKDSYLIGFYDAKNGGISFNNQILSLNQFALLYYQRGRGQSLASKPAVNAWRECECEIDGKWVSTYSLPG